ncbi:MAG: hypothetical protein STHCBS139747_006368 [Sporothrix thermara]
MKIQILNLAAIFATALAIPHGEESRSSYVPCTGLDSPQCCATSVLGVANLDCKTPPSDPTSATNFKAICGSDKPQCCLLSLAGLALVCVTPPGTS